MTYNLPGDPSPHTIDTQKLMSYYFELGPMRPPSEGGSHSLLLRPTRNCSWNRCRFCFGAMYEKRKLEIRTVEELKQDIDTVKAIADEIVSASWKLGCGGNVNGEVGNALLRSNPRLNTHHSFVVVFNWLYFGAKTVFLQDANSLIVPTPQLVEIITYLKETFPSIERVTSYARAKTISKKSTDELKQLRTAGLSRLHVGLETGDDELLKYVDKGVTAAEQIEGGKKAMETGFELSEYVMPDLGGRTRSEQHARNTARVLNEINPHFIRMRPFIPGPGTPIYEDYIRGDLVLSSPHERLQEIRTMVENLEITGRLCFDHFMNGWYRDPGRNQNLFKLDYDGYKFPEEKNLVLQLIEEGLRIDESVHMHAKEVVGMRNL
ncbi:MAG: radical SAM protein [Chloroflexota bacterium]|nr:radical SAM protein [Chloroflexota bacterium]